MSARDALGVLGLTSDNDPGALRGAYLAAVKTAHPDKPGGDAAKLRRVIEAYEVLRAKPVDEEAPSRAPEPRSARPSRPARSPEPSSQGLEITPTEAVVGGTRTVSLDGVGEVAVHLPPGLRVGDLVAVSGVAMTVSISGGQGGAIVGNHLCLTIQVDRAILASGGDVEVKTPRGPLKVRISRQDASRSLVRVAGRGLPARGRHDQGDLFIKLEPLAAEGFETPARVLLRRFAASWAA